MRRRRWWALTLGVAALSIAGATSFREWGAGQLLRAPNATRAPLSNAPPPGARALFVDVGPPRARLAAWVFDPPGPPRATLLALHGLRDDKRTLVGLARRMTRDEVRVVLLDLRGHGASTGETLTYGAVEGRDARQVVAALDRRGLLVEPLGVYGASYGGAVAHQLAGLEPRVRAVVSVAAFADLPGLMRDYAELSWPAIAWALPESALRSLARRTAERGGFTVRATDAAAAAARSDAAALLFHGDADEVVPFSHGQRIARACAPRCRLVRLPGLDHVRVMRDPRVRAGAQSFWRDQLGVGPSAER